MPRAEYVEYLKTNGASEDDIKALTEGPGAATAIRSFDNLQARVVAEATKAAADARAEVDKTWNEFYSGQVTPKYEEMAQKLLLSQANEARARTALLESQDAGLKKVAEQMGYKPDGAPAGTPPAAGAPANFDPSKYVTMEQAQQLAATEGDAIATVQDIAAEHASLFPGQRLNWRELRKDAVARRISVEALWSEKFKVPEARAAADAKAKADYEATIRADERKKAESELASRFGNPDARPLVPSNSPFTPRPATGRDKMPWDRDENEASRDRVSRATTKVMQSLTH